MTPWTPQRERRAIVAHVARCRFCQGLLAQSRRRRDRALLDAAEALALERFADELDERPALAHAGRARDNGER